MRIKAYAKLNLTLRILGLRPDGFHDLESVMQNISLFDDIILEDIPQGIIISCSEPSIPVNEKNICYKAAKLIIDDYAPGKGVKISITKRIPSEAGMGGGSADGAAVLMGLNKLWGLGLSERELMTLGAKIGSDVPFFLVGGTGFCRGRGEIVESRKSKVERFLVIKPAVSVPTKWAYGQWDKAVESEKRKVESGSGASEPSALQRFSTSDLDCFNDLEDVVIPDFPQIAQAKQDLQEAGCSYAQMTGSGSAVFGVIGEAEIGNMELSRLRSKYVSVFQVGSVDKGVEIL